MAVFDLDSYATLIAAVDAAVTPNDKGARFEDLGHYLMSILNGTEVVERDIDMQAEEIDLVVWNAQIEEVLKPWDGVILVECKNWSVAVGAPQLDSFIAKLRRRSLRTGIFIAANGVTGTYADAGGGAFDIIKSALHEGIRVITLTMDDLREITCGDDLRQLIKRRFCGLFVHKILN